MLIANFFTSQMAPSSPAYEVSYSKFRSLLEEGRILSLHLRGREAEGELDDNIAIGPKGEVARRFTTRLPELDDETLIPALRQHQVDISVSSTEEHSVLLAIVFNVLPWVILIAFWVWLMRRAQRNISGGLGGGGELGKFLRRKFPRLPSMTWPARMPPNVKLPNWWSF